MAARQCTVTLRNIRVYLADAMAHFESICRRDLVEYYRDGLELVSLFMYGAPEDVTPRRVIVADVPCPELTRVPRWKQELLSRPLRKIVKVTVVRESSPYAHSQHVVWEEKLECGHVHVHMPFTPEDRRARRRRCKQCQSSKRSVLSAMSATSHSKKSAACTSVSTATRFLRPARAASA